MFFFNDTATTEIYTLSLHDALPISRITADLGHAPAVGAVDQDQHPSARGYERTEHGLDGEGPDRKSTRLNSSHANISYAVFCLKKKQRRPTRDRQSARLNSSPSPIS